MQKKKGSSWTSWSFYLNDGITIKFIINLSLKKHNG